MSGDDKLFVRQADGWTERGAEPGAAERLSRELDTFVVDFSIATAVDQIWIRAYRDGVLVRELRYARDGGWSKHGTPLPFENGRVLGTWLRKRRLLASPDGYDVLDAFLGRQPPEPVVDPGGTYVRSFSPAHAAELRAVAERAGVTVSAVVEASWHLGKRAVYDRLMARAAKLGLDLTMLVDDPSPPSPVEPPPAFVHDPLDVPHVDLTRYQRTAIDHHLALSTRMLAELERLQTMFDVRAHALFDEAYLHARRRLA